MNSNELYVGCNNDIQGITKEKPQYYEIYMSGVSQYSVQNKYKDPVTSLLSHISLLNRNTNYTPSKCIKSEGSSNN